MITIHTDFSATRRVDNLLVSLGDRLREETNRQTLYFISQIQRMQMSGRRGPRYLNVVTGTLRRGWFPETQIIAGAIRTRAFTNVRYARIWQYGGTFRRPARQAILSFRSGRRGFVRPSDLVNRRGQAREGARQQRVNIPESEGRVTKRLFIIEAFEDDMPQRYRNALLRVVLEGWNG